MKLKYWLLVTFMAVGVVRPAAAQYVRGATSYGFVPGYAYYHVPPAVISSPANFWWPGYYDQEAPMSVYVNSNRFDPLDGGAWTAGRKAINMQTDGKYGWGMYGWGIDSWGFPYYSNTYIPSY